MTVRHRQSGMSIPGILAILLMLGFFAMCIIRMTPPYLEYLSVKKLISETAMDPDIVNNGGGGHSLIRKRIGNLFNTNQIYLLKPNEVEVFSKKGKTYIDANYEVRLPVMWRIDSVLKFDDLFYEVGNPDPQPRIKPDSDVP
jgi:hypothetical protein